ncbi:MAG TPA: CoA-acylating methylmalonate-semialdehyde dehydrogenase, partial [Chthonomonadales bacterium]|nr:CoA-acylating methylmalonate-semialdehyde dehydrogenase [Chthonomonadales bacterium]
MQAHEIRIARNLIGARWCAPEAAESFDVHNPSTGEKIASTPAGGPAEVQAAAAAAQKAFLSWSRTPPLKRASALFRYRQILEDHFEELAALVTLENGKTQEEARGDVRRGIEVVEFACGIPQLLKGESLPQVADGIDALTSSEPVGVCAGITPFNFPAMVPLWMFPIAIACGNAFILKPSEKTPLTACRLGELLLEAGLPEGVFQIVHGGRQAVEALCDSPGISAISFVGSSAVAARVYARGCAAGKRVQAAGGAKNVLLVMPDADPDSCLKAIMGSAFGCAGQRCMAGSLLMAVGEDAGRVQQSVLAAMDRIKVGPTHVDGRVDMGAVIDGCARDRLMTRIGVLAGEGGELARDGRRDVPAGGFFVGPTLVDAVTPEMTIFREEIFGPVLGVMRPRSLDEAISWMRGCGYGNGATIFTSSGAAAREFV